MSRSFFVSLLPAALVLCGLASSTTALAQTPDELQKARQDFQEGVSLAAANNCSAALSKFRAVARVKSTPQVSFNIAECEARMGRLAAALGDYRLAASAASGDKTLTQLYGKISERVTAIEGRVPKIKITRGKGAEMAKIELDGTELGDAQLGTEIPVDPGPHVVTGLLKEKEYAHQNITVAEKEIKTVDLTMEVPAAQVEAPPGPAQTPEQQTPPPAETKGRSRVPGIVIAAGGAVSIGVGIAFLAARGSTISQLDALCGAGQTSCPTKDKSRGQSIADSGKLDTGLAEVTVGIGSIALITGVVLAATAGPPKPAAQPAASTSTLHLSFLPSAPSASIGGASLRGNF